MIQYYTALGRYELRTNDRGEKHLQGSGLQAGILAAIQPHIHTVGAVLLGRCEAARREVLADAAQLLARMIAAQLL